MVQGAFSFHIHTGPKWFPFCSSVMDLVLLIFLSLILTSPCYKFSGSLFSCSVLGVHGTLPLPISGLLSRTYNFFQSLLCIDPRSSWNLYMTYVYSTNEWKSHHNVESQCQSRLLLLFHLSHNLSEKIIWWDHLITNIYLANYLIERDPKNQTISYLNNRQYNPNLSPIQSLLHNWSTKNPWTVLLKRRVGERH